MIAELLDEPYWKELDGYIDEAYKSSPVIYFRYRKALLSTQSETYCKVSEVLSSLIQNFWNYNSPPIRRTSNPLAGFAFFSLTKEECLDLMNNNLGDVRKDLNHDLYFISSEKYEHTFDEDREFNLENKFRVIKSRNAGLDRD